MCRVGLHRYCNHPATVTTHNGSECIACGMPMEYSRSIRGWMPVSDIQYCTRECGHSRGY